MTTFAQNHRLIQVDRESRRLFGGLLLGVMLVSVSATAEAEEAVQMNALFSPSKALRQAEARGRIMIYDGLDATDVDRALDQQFDRIQSMMFIRTRHTEPDGTVSIEEDDC
jgi:hypothetical protein